jgi:hypothetical protein
MPRRKPKPEKVVQEKIKESLDSIIMEESLDDILPGVDELPRLKTTEMMDFSGEKSTALSDAKALLDSITNFYVDMNHPESHVENKKRMDTMNLSSMMFQLKSAQHAITKLLEEIDLGNIHPRIFEVLAQLQSQIMQMPKDYQAYLEKMEQNYKKAKIEIEEKNVAGGIVMDQTQGLNGTFNPNPQALATSGGIKSRGTRGIMEGLRDILGAEIVDVKPMDIHPDAVVNARDKKIIDAQRESHTDNDDSIDSGYIIEDDILE